MKTVWFVQDMEMLGGIGTIWDQSCGLSRNERTGRWTLYDRRDARRNREGWSERRWSFRDWEELQSVLRETDWTADALLDDLGGFEQPAFVELRRLITSGLARGAAESG